MRASDVIQLLASNDIHCYRSAELLKFEQHMTLYFEREYQRWQGNNNPPEQYGTSSFEGSIANWDTYVDSIDHYNKNLSIYQAFLDPEYMCYTMGYFGATNQSPSIDNEITLTRAQINKFELIIERAEIRDGQNILELGSGFGGFAQYLLCKFPNIRLTAINPSRIQTSYLKDTLLAGDAAFSPHCVRLIEKYFDDISPDDLKENDFDRVVSIGVLEAVTNMDKLFQLISRVLKPGGKTLHHFIVSVDTIPRFLNAENTLMANYFPGGHIWPYSELKRHNTHLQFAASWFVNGMNYWKTLDEWHNRFWQEIERIFPDYLSIDEVQDWNKYFVLCKTMFKPNKGRSYGVGHYLYIKG
jgi:cyclopropane-fatty-acyl-phospholipid synthase